MGVILLVAFILILIWFYNFISKEPTKIEIKIPDAKSQKLANAILNNKIGIDFYYKKNYTEAIKYFNIAFFCDLNPVYVHNRGNSYFNLKDYRKALRDYTDAIILNPNEHKYFISRAKSRICLDDLLGAINDYKLAIKIHPCYEYYFASAEIKLRKSVLDYNGAIQDLDNAIKYNSQDTLYYFRRGYCKRNLKDFFGAIEDYNQMIVLKPSDYHPYFCIAKCKAELNDHAGAIENITIYINYILKKDGIPNILKNPFTGLYWSDRADYYYRNNQIELAIKDWEFLAKFEQESFSAKAKQKLEEHSKKFFVKVKTLKIETDAGISFKISRVSPEGYKYFALWDYYPTNRFPANSLNRVDLENRHHLFNFKDGVNPDLFANKIAPALIKQFGLEKLSKIILLIIPASNKIKTKTRFEVFCQKLSSMTGLINGFHILNNNEKEKIPVHNGGNRNEDLINFVKLTESIKGKDLIVLDDVRTTGNSSNKVFRFLKLNGANKIIFVYISKTISSRDFDKTISNNKFTY